MLLIFVFILGYIVNIIYSQLFFGYHSYDNLTIQLKKYVSKYPNKAYLYSIGKSVQNRDLWVLALADTNPNKHITLRPEAKYIGNMHGNEAPSKEILLHLIDYMLSNQSNDLNVDYLMKNTRVHIMPLMNPDGYESSIMGDCIGDNGKYNAKNYNLNRNFPDLFECNPDPIQPETEAVINWLNNGQFLLSANFHTGSIVANYPFDNVNMLNNISSIGNPSLDNDVFISMALNYSFNHPYMRYANCGNETFLNGITNGAAWYPPFRGGMQDFNYWKFGSYEITIEFSCCNFPLPNELEQLWNDNRKSLLSYLSIANTGIRGIISFSNGLIAKYLTVKFDSREPFFKTNEYGEYYRILLPGTYLLELTLNCDISLYKTKVTITESNGGLYELNITISDQYYQIYLTSFSNLNRFGIFCTNNKRPTSCSINKSLLLLNNSLFIITSTIFLILFLK